MAVVKERKLIALDVAELPAPHKIDQTLKNDDVRIEIAVSHMVISNPMFS